MCTIVMPEASVPLAPLKLVTMTIAISTNLYLNLSVVAEHIPLGSQVLNVSYRKIKRGKFKFDVTGDDIVNDSEKFKNQCTFDIDIGEKIINTKIFNNGKIINVGCLDKSHAVKAVSIIMREIHGLSGQLVIPRVNLYTNKNIKKFFKDDLRKKFSALIQLFACSLNKSFDLSPFDPHLSADDAYGIFADLIMDPTYECQLMYIYTIIQVLKNYYDEKTLTAQMDNPEFQRILNLMLTNTDESYGEIRAVFPSYTHMDRPFPDTYEPEIVLINKSTNSGYFINRNNLEQLLNQESRIITCKFDKNRYPGVIIEFQTSVQCGEKLVKIILFNTGKINITAARTNEQVQEAYDFINAFCQQHFDQLLLKSEYVNKIKDYESNLPDQFNVGLVKTAEGIENHFYLLKKSSIMANPRNLRILKLHGYLEHFI
jgi:TATA-box binding protein (TBP) (component of TFIID and TFIIIB)